MKPADALRRCTVAEERCASFHKGDFAEALPAAEKARRNRGSGGRIASEGEQGDLCRNGGKYGNS